MMASVCLVGWFEICIRFGEVDSKAEKVYELVME